MKKDHSKRTSGIDIDEKYAIVTMPMDYALAKRQKNKAGTVYYIPFAFYGTIHGCLKEYVKQAVRDALDVETSISLNEAVERVEKAVERANSVIRETFPEYRVTRVPVEGGTS